jgi:hypothetical protein
MPRPDDYDDYDDQPSRSAVPFPVGVKAAGIIWICFGVLGLGSSVLSLVLQGGQAAAGGQRPQGNVCSVGCSVLFALGFLMVGFQTVKGTAKGTLGNGIGSLVFGLIYAGLTVLLFAAGIAGPAGGPAGMGLFFIVIGGLCALLGLALLTAGILAIAGRGAYADWREATGAGPRRRRRSLEEDDYDDRRGDEYRDRPRRSADQDDYEDRPGRGDDDRDHRRD